MKQAATVTYLMKQIPRDLWTQAKAKAKAQDPPVSMKWLLLALLKRWVATDPPKPSDGPSDSRSTPLEAPNEPTRHARKDSGVGF